MVSSLLHQCGRIHAQSSHDGFLPGLEVCAAHQARLFCERLCDPQTGFMQAVEVGITRHEKKLTKRHLPIDKTLRIANTGSAAAASTACNGQISCLVQLQHLIKTRTRHVTAI